MKLFQSYPHICFVFRMKEMLRNVVDRESNLKSIYTEQKVTLRAYQNENEYVIILLSILFVYIYIYVLLLIMRCIYIDY